MSWAETTITCCSFFPCKGSNQKSGQWCKTIAFIAAHNHNDRGFLDSLKSNWEQSTSDDGVLGHLRNLTYWCNIDPQASIQLGPLLDSIQDVHKSQRQRPQADIPGANEDFTHSDSDASSYWTGFVQDPSRNDSLFWSPNHQVCELIASTTKKSSNRAYLLAVNFAQKPGKEHMYQPSCQLVLTGTHADRPRMDVALGSCMGVQWIQSIRSENHLFGLAKK